MPCACSALSQIKKDTPGGQCHEVKKKCHSEPVRKLAWESPKQEEIATPACALVRNDSELHDIAPEGYPILVPVSGLRRPAIVLGDGAPSSLADRCTTSSPCCIRHRRRRAARPDSICIFAKRSICVALVRSLITYAVLYAVRG